ncbi:MAG: hypothetical protein V3573_14575 [Desulfovibrionaceae bacterium]
MIFAHYTDEGPIDYAGADPRITAFWCKLFVFQTVEEFRIVRHGIEIGKWPRKNAQILHVFDDDGEFGNEVLPVGIFYPEQNEEPTQ